MIIGVRIANTSKMGNAHIRIQCIANIANCGHRIGLMIRERRRNNARKIDRVVVSSQIRFYKS